MEWARLDVDFHAVKVGRRAEGLEGVFSCRQTLR